MDLMKIYENKNGVVQEYEGGVTFPKKTKVCKCGGKMTLKPLFQPYVERKDGFILVDVKSKGFMFVKKNDIPLCSWNCEKCMFGETETKEKIEPYVDKMVIV